MSEHVIVLGAGASVQAGGPATGARKRMKRILQALLTLYLCRTLFPISQNPKLDTTYMLLTRSKATRINPKKMVWWVSCGARKT
jgi:hypothetical protein